MRESYYSNNRPGADQKDKQGWLTWFEAGVLLTLLGIFILGGFVFYKVTSQSAYDITARHDLTAFADYQAFYYKLHGKCVGNTGEIIRREPEKSDLVMDTYQLSEGVIISIVSGNPERPYDKENPYVFQCRHTHSKTVFEMNFTTGEIIEK